VALDGLGLRQAKHGAQVTSFTANQLTLIIIERQWHAQGFGAKRVSRGGTRMTHEDSLMGLYLLVFDPVLWPGTAVMCETEGSPRSSNCVLQFKSGN
jgi:hypothetical protein